MRGGICMARTKATNTASASNNKGAEVEQKKESKNNETKTKAPAENKGKENIEPLTDDTDIEVVSLVKNVSYFDEKTGDRYVWEEIGDVNYIPFGVLKNMYRHFKGYFLGYYIRPNDERVIKQFKLERTYKKYDDVLNKDNFVGKKIDALCEVIKNLPDALKFTTFARIQTWVSDGEITDITVVRTLEKVFGLDLYSLLNKD
jgi:hypothetical protein